MRRTVTRQLRSASLNRNACWRRDRVSILDWSAGMPVLAAGPWVARKLWSAAMDIAELPILRLDRPIAGDLLSAREPGLRSVRCGSGIEHGLHRRFGRVAGNAGDSRRSRRVAGRRSMDQQRLHAVSLRTGPARRGRRRRVRRAQHLCDGHRRVHGDVAGLRAVDRRPDADRDAGSARDRRGIDGTGQPGDHRQVVSRRHTRQGDRHLGGLLVADHVDGTVHRRHGAVVRCRLDVAPDLCHQRADRAGRARPALLARAARPADATAPARHSRCSACHRRARRDGVGAHQLRIAGKRAPRFAFRVAGGGTCAVRRLHPVGVAGESADGQARAVPLARLFGRQCLHADPVLRLQCGAVLPADDAGFRPGAGRNGRQAW